MNRQSQTQMAQSAQLTMPQAGGLLLRKCACGNHTIAGSQCQDCGNKRQFGLQTKLQVSEPGDVYEQEADRIADQVMAVSAHPSLSTARPRIQRFSGQSNGQINAAPASLDHTLSSPGRPLEPELRQDMEWRFGHDFSRVRVHSGSDAEQSARDVRAHAYTLGNDIVFDTGQFAPGTRQGRRLIAHELVHVLQQSGADGIRVGQSNEKRGLSPVSAAHFVAPAVVQRACGETQIGETEIEDDGVYKKDLSDPGVEGTLVRFRVGCDEFLTPADEARLRGLAGSLSGRTRIVIHGFASEEGSPTFNQMLSLARAAKARAILSRLIDPLQIERVIWHGSVPGNRMDRRSVIIQTESPLPPVTKTLTIVSWINGTDLPSFSRSGLLIAPGDSIAPLATCMALKCTANTPPPTSLPPSALSAFIASKQYRGVQNYALTYLPSTSARGEFFSRQIPGYTAPSSCGPVPPSTFVLGETSPLNYASADMSGPDPRADALMKLRVSSVEESEALDEATSFPGSLLLSLKDLRHVPWIWTQTRLRLDARTGLLNWVVAGSDFPTHTIYLDGVRVDEISQGPCRVLFQPHLRTADMPRQTMEEEAKQAKVPIDKQEETVRSGGRSIGRG